MRGRVFPGLRGLACLLLAAVLLSSPAALARVYPEKEHLPVDYEEMLPVTSFDETALLSALEEMEALCGRHSRRGPDSETRRRLEELYRQTLEEADILITKAALADIQYDAGGGAEEDAALALELSAQQTRLLDRCYQAFGVLAASPYKDILDDSAGEGAARSILGYQGLSKEDAALRDEEDRLVQAYQQLMASGEETRDREAGEIYRRLLQLRTGIAARSGFDSFPAYAYRMLYNRDYALEDAAALREAVKDRILPLQLRLLEDIPEADIRALNIRSRKSGEELLDSVGPFVHDFSREMGETFDFMREHHLYDIEFSQEKIDGGYTVALPAYGTAFIYNAPYGELWDYGDLVHEFGHFNETFHSTEHALWSDFNIDVGEIHSQALELIFTGWAGEIFGQRYGEAYTKVMLYGILDSILTGCLFDEFQEAAFRNPEISVEELNRLYKRLSEEYGAVYEPGVEEDSSWVEVPHNFQNPMYIISYATSGLSALDLWFLYLERPRQGRDVYLELSALSLSAPYRSAIKETGLADIFGPETVPALADTLEDYLEGRAPSRGFSWTPLLACIAVGYIIFCVLLMAKALKVLSRYGGRRRRTGEPGEAPQSREDPWSAHQEKPPWEL